jgi:5'-nucleotidase
MMAALAAAATLALVAALARQASNAAGKKPAAPGKTTMDIQMLSFNDFHGNLEPPTGSSGTLVTGYTENAAGTAPCDDRARRRGRLPGHQAAQPAGRARELDHRRGR